MLTGSLSYEFVGQRFKFPPDCNAYALNEGLAKYGSSTKSVQPFVYRNKIVLELSHTYSLIYYLELRFLHIVIS